MASIFELFICSLSHWIKSATWAKQLENLYWRDEMLAGVQEPSTWVFWAKRLGCIPWLWISNERLAVYKRNRGRTEPCSTLLVMKLSGQIGLVYHDAHPEICWKGTILANWAQYWGGQKHTLVYLVEFDGWQSKDWRNPADLGSCCQSWGECQSISYWRVSRAICWLSLVEDCVPLGK